MADICEATKACSSEPGARETANEARRFRFVPVVKAVLPADDAGRKRRRLDSSASSSPVVLRSDPGDDCVENRPEHGDGTGEGVAGECPGYGVTSVCGRRREMEDAVSVRPYFVRGDHRYHFFGVYDGHGCSHVAESCRNRMHEVVAEEISTSRPGSNREWCAVMERSFARMDAAGRPGDPPPAPTCRCELQTPRCDHVGSTAVVAVVGPDRIVVANCGDSRAVLCHDGAPVHLSTDHKPDRPDELRRIEAAGGRVIYWDGARVLGVLAMSRAIGDNYLKPYVISKPEVTVTERKEGDECLLLASDGLWDVVSNEVACGIARTCLRNSTAAAGDNASEGNNCGGGSDKGCADAAILLTKLALARHSTDNVSVVVINLRTRL